MLSITTNIALQHIMYTLLIVVHFFVYCTCTCIYHMEILSQGMFNFLFIWSLVVDFSIIYIPSPVHLATLYCDIHTGQKGKKKLLNNLSIAVNKGHSCSGASFRVTFVIYHLSLIYYLILHD